MGFYQNSSFFPNAMFTIIPIFIAVMFFFILGTIVVRSIRGAKQWKKNNDSPVLTVDATVVSKRADVSYYSHGRGVDDMPPMSSSSTTYFVTFEVSSGDRMEFAVPDTEYGMLVEQDSGKLTFQGTRFLGFERAV